MKPLHSTWFKHALLGFFSLAFFQGPSAQTWSPINGIAAQDIAVGKNGSVWATAINNAIYRWDGLAWETMPGAATRIAVGPNGDAWVINANGNIFKYNSALSNSWELKTGAASDIGVGADGSVWIIGTNTVGGGHSIYRLNGSTWTMVPGGAVHVGVEPSGNAWVVNSNNNIYRYDGSSFALQPGSAKDIAVGADGSVWCTGPDNRILRWDGKNWAPQSGMGTQISVAPEGNAWIVDNTGKVFHSIDAGSTPMLVRVIFPRKQTYEYAMLKTLNYGTLNSSVMLGGIKGTYNNLDDLGKAFGTYALLAAEILFAQNPTITADQVLVKLGSDDKAKSSLNGILYTIVSASIVSKQDPSISFESRLALRTWCENLLWSVKVRSAKAILSEYRKWKADPCSYQADGYKAPPDCALKGLNFTQWYGTRTPPEDIIGKAGLKSVLANNADAFASGVSIAVATAALTASGIAVFSGLGTGAALFGAGSMAGAAGITSSLFMAFGGTATTSTALMSGAIGAVSWAGVIAAPVAAAILSIVVGTVEGFRVVEAVKIEPMLKMKLGAAMTDHINLANAMADSNARNMFFIAFQDAAMKNYIIPDPKVDGEVRFYCQAGYVSSFKLSYDDVNGKNQSSTTPDLSVGTEKSFTIPYNATNIHVQGWYLAGGWKELFNQTLDRPTFVCYTSYGTVFEPKVKNDCPEVGSMTTKPNELTVTQGGGYAAKIKLTYDQNGKTVTLMDDGSVSAGWRKVFSIPAGATNIHLQAWSNTGLVWDQWKSIIDKTWPSPPNECIKVYGTTLDPKWDNECN